VELRAPDYVVVVVDDLERGLRFYRDVLGLPLAHRSGPYAQFATGTTRVSLYERAAMGETLGRALVAPDPAAPAFELGFKVDDCDRAYQQLVGLGAEPAVVPTDRPWGQRTAYVRDPDGHLLELAQDLESSGQTE
jgi:lactoylglutathione lyase